MEAHRIQQQEVASDFAVQYQYGNSYRELFSQQHKTYLVIKRMLDIAFSCISIVALSPIFLVISVIIKLTSPGSVFYSSPRYGKDCSQFGMLKFRSMVKDADKILESLSDDKKVEYEKNRKINDDNRITTIGRVLRKASADELPQIFNVFLGEMSIIGPRPPLLDEDVIYGQKLSKIMVTLPGISGPWQVNGRNDLAIEERININENYIDHFGLWQDIKIFFKTFAVVFSQKGAK